MSITAKELAQKLNISATAVSMALNNKPGVSIETRNKVLSEAEHYGFDFSKLSIKRNKTGCIHLIAYKTNNAIMQYTPIFTEIIDGIEEECKKEGYHLKKTYLSEQNDDIDRYLEDIRITDCIGILLLGTEIHKESYLKFLKLPFPIILVDTYFDSIDCSSVTINNEQGAYLATSYLIGQHSNQPGYLSSCLRIGNFEERKRGYFKALRDYGMSTATCIVHELSPTIDGAMSDMLEIIDSKTTLAKSYFCDNDQLAIGAIKALKLRGYHIPEDIAIIGFDNISEGRVIEPALTSINIPRHFMGKTAVRQLLQQLDDPTPHSIKIEISTKLIKRFSC